MPLIKSASKVAVALNIAHRARANGGKVHVGALTGATPGRADAIKAKVPDGSHILSADCVSALGGGNTAAGHAVLSKMFPESSINSKQSKAFGKKFPKPLAMGGDVDVALSDGEFCVPPSEVLRVGGGYAERGHAILDAFQMHVRENNIRNLQHLPGPEQD
jgi:hypothetical protein